MPVQTVIDSATGFHRKLLGLCDRLERLADGLPNAIDRQECLVLARDIFPAIKAAHDFEERSLFPLLRRPDTEEGLERMRFEHWEDEAYAEEISDALSRIGKGMDVENVEKLAWMLRGFFDGVRRHIAFEAEHLMPMLHNQSTTAVTS